MARTAVLLLDGAQPPAEAIETPTLPLALHYSRSEAWSLAFNLETAPSPESPLFSVKTSVGPVWTNFTAATLCARADECLLMVNGQAEPISIHKSDLSEIELSILTRANALAPGLIERMARDYDSLWRFKRLKLQMLRCIAAKAGETAALSSPASRDLADEISLILDALDREVPRASG